MPAPRRVTAIVMAIAISPQHFLAMAQTHFV